MVSRTQKIMNLLQTQVTTNNVEHDPLLSENTSNADDMQCSSNYNEGYTSDVSDAPSIPKDVEQELRGILDFDSDDSIQDPHYLPNKDDEYYAEQEDGNIVSENEEIGEARSRQEINVNNEDAAVHVNSKRTIKETRKMRQERKEKRNVGKAYVTKRGKCVAEKSMKELKQCRNKCRGKFSDDLRLNLFQEFWSMGSYDRRVQYVTNLIEIKEKKTIRIRTSDTKKQRYRQNTVSYFFQLDGVRSLTCKDCFIKTFDVSNKFIEVTIAKKRVSTSGIVDLDQRGKNENRNKISEEEKEIAQNHILSIPTYESHYTRRRSSKRYLPSYYTLTSLYEAYKQKYPQKPINRKAYEKIFHDLNISIKQPKKDTCSTCDKLVMKIKMSKTPDSKIELENQLAVHHLKADQGYTSKEADRKATKTVKNKKTITFDLQQCLPTPDIQSGDAFYKRQLWTYNLTIHDCDDVQAYCYLWYESMAKRGGNEIGSCLYRYLTKDLDTEVNNITMYSDSCAGQNKNSFITATCFVALQNSTNLKTIDHKFLLPGHTHMECDTDHCLIEKKKKKFNGKIEHPHDWAQLIRQVGKKKPFAVREMERSDFFDFSGLFNTVLTNRKRDSVGSNLNWRDVRWLRYEKNNKTLFYKNSLDDNEIFKAVNLEKRGKGNEALHPKKAYTQPLPITVEKKQHLMDLLPYISESLWDFYKNIPTENDLVDVLPDTSEEEGED